MRRRDDRSRSPMRLVVHLGHESDRSRRRADRSRSPLRRAAPLTLISPANDQGAFGQLVHNVMGKIEELTQTVKSLAAETRAMRSKLSDLEETQRTYLARRSSNSTSASNRGLEATHRVSRVPMTPEGPGYFSSRAPRTPTGEPPGSAAPASSRHSPAPFMPDEVIWDDAQGGGWRCTLCPKRKNVYRWATEGHHSSDEHQQGLKAKKEAEALAAANCMASE